MKQQTESIRICSRKASKNFKYEKSKMFRPHKLGNPD